jgi:hypothetical protein
MPEIPKGDFLTLVRNTLNRPSDHFFQCLNNAYRQVKSDEDLRNFIQKQPHPFNLDDQKVVRICSLLCYATRKISGIYGRQVALLELQQSLSNWPEYVRDRTAELKKDDENDAL